MELSEIRVGLTEEEGMTGSVEVIRSSITSAAGVDSKGASEYLKLILFLNCCAEGENTGVLKGNIICFVVVVGVMVVEVVVVFFCGHLQDLLVVFFGGVVVWSETFSLSVLFISLKLKRLLAR